MRETQCCAGFGEDMGYGEVHDADCKGGAMSYTPGPWKYVGTRYPLQAPNGDRVEMHVVVTNHPNGEWESIYSHTEADAILSAGAPDLLVALRAILAEPFGCAFCDSGKLRNPAKNHEANCGYVLARAAVARVEGR